MVLLDSEIGYDDLVLTVVQRVERIFHGIGNGTAVDTLVSQRRSCIGKYRQQTHIGTTAQRRINGARLSCTAALYTHLAAFLQKGFLDLLTNKSDGIVDKAQATLSIKLTGCLHQTNVSLTDQIVNGQSLSLILSGYTYDETQISLDELVQCTLVASLDTTGKTALLVFRKELRLTDLVKINIQ